METLIEVASWLFAIVVGIVAVLILYDILE